MRVVIKWSLAVYAQIQCLSTLQGQLYSDLWLGINVCLQVLGNAHNGTVPLPLHDALQGCQPLTHLQRLALNDDLFALGHGPEIRHVQVASDAEELPEPGLADENQGDGGAQVEEGGGRAAVEVAQAVAVVLEAGECKCDGGCWGIGICGRDDQMGEEFGHPFLRGRLLAMVIKNGSLVCERADCLLRPSSGHRRLW